MRAGNGKRLGAGAIAMLLLAACGSDDSGDADGSDDAGDPSAEVADSVAATEPASADDDAGAATAGDDAGSAASIDPAAMPGPAEAVLTVNGETIMYAPPDADDSRLFTCDLGADRITVNIQTADGHDLLVQVAVLDTGEWAGSVVGKSRDHDRNYQGTRTYATDAFAVDGQYMTFVGPFEYYLDGDPANFMDAGEGQIAVTCP